MSMEKIDAKAIVAILLTMLLFSSAVVAIRIGLQGYSAASLALLRCLVASLCMGIIFYYRPKKNKISLRTLVYGLLLGALGIGFYNLALNYGEHTVTASIASFLICQLPIMTLLLAVFFLNERVSWQHYVGMAVSFVGIFFIILGESRGSAYLDVGVFVILSAVLSMSIFGILQKKLHPYINAIEITSLAMWGGTLFLLFATPQLFHSLAIAPWQATASGIYMGIFPGAIAYTTWSYALSRAPASKIAVYFYLIPLFATLIAWALIDEVPHWLGLIGGLIALIGAVFTQFSPKPKQLAENL